MPIFITVQQCLVFFNNFYFYMLQARLHHCVLLFVYTALMQTGPWKHLAHCAT